MTDKKRLRRRLRRVQKLETVGAVLHRFDILYPDNGLSMKQKTTAISSAEQRIASVLGMTLPPVEYTNPRTKLMIKFPFDDYYVVFLAKIAAKTASEQAEYETTLQNRERIIRAILGRK